MLKCSRKAPYHMVIRRIREGLIKGPDLGLEMHCADKYVGENVL